MTWIKLISAFIVVVVLLSGCIDISDEGYTTVVNGNVSKVIEHPAGLGYGPCTVRMSDNSVYDVRYLSNCVNLTEGDSVILHVYYRFHSKDSNRWVELVERQQAGEQHE